MRDEKGVLRVAVPSHSKTAQRKRRLARGIQRWDFDRSLCAEPVRRIATGTLTVKDSDYELVMGQVRQFWRRVRQRWLGARYFCWLEVQRRGAVHYHWVWLNPPPIRHKAMYAWVDKAWGMGRTQYRVQYQRGALQAEIDYAIGYAKKMGKKSYQQIYEDVPSSLRTFMTQRLEIPPKQVDEHLELDEWVYVGEGFRDSDPLEQLVAIPSYESGHPTPVIRRQLLPAYLEYRGRREHVVPIGGQCTALLYRRQRK